MCCRKWEVDKQRLQSATTTFDTIEANLASALDLARDCHSAYLAADAYVRRLFNQAFFVRLEITDDGIHAQLAEPFDMLLGGNVANVVAGAEQASRARREPGLVTMDDVLGAVPGQRTSPEHNNPDNAETPRALCAAGGLGLSASLPLRGVEGLKEAVLVRVIEEKLHIIEAEISRWRDILSVSYQEYLISK